MNKIEDRQSAIYSLTNPGVYLNMNGNDANLLKCKTHELSKTNLKLLSMMNINYQLAN